MAPLLMFPLFALFLGVSPGHAGDASRQAGDAAALSSDAAAGGGEAAAREGAARPFDGNSSEATTVVAPGQTRPAARLPKPTPGDRPNVVGPPSVPQKDSEGGISSGLMLGGTAFLGGLQGWFSAGLLGAAAGAGLGLAAAWLLTKKDYGGAFGVTAGAIVGTALGGPIGGLIGAAVGGVIGHFLGKLFG